jgi:3-oxoacyl-[acyl-carrier protein] reductase
VRFKDKVVIITGSSSGIGKATAIKFAGEGAKIVVNCRSNIGGAQEVVEEIKRPGGQVIFVRADVAEPGQVKELFAETLRAFGTVDILINNAGSAVGKPFLETTKEDWIEAFDDNFFGTVLCSQQAAIIMLEKGAGKIINTASIRGIGHTGREGIMAYSAAKAAVINFTKTLAKELAPDVTVNAVAPGFVYTPNYDSMPEELKAEFISGTPIKRFLDVDEIADAFLYLASTDAVTGEVLVVDGGFTLK